MADQRTYKMLLGEIADGGGGAGGGGVFIINISQEKVVNPEDETDWWYVYHPDKTQAEMQTAYENGLLIVAKPAVNGMYISGETSQGEFEHDYVIPPYSTIMTNWNDETDTPEFVYQTVEGEDGVVITERLGFYINGDAFLGSWEAITSLIIPQGE